MRRRRCSTGSAVRVLEWRAAARADLLAILDYISDDNPDAAQKLKGDIEAKAAKLIEHPRLYREGRVSGTREMVVRLNYVVVYAEDERRVAILRVLHAAQQWPSDNGEPTGGVTLPGATFKQGKCPAVKKA